MHERGTPRRRGRLDAALTRWFATSQMTHRQVFALLMPVVAGQAWVIGQVVVNPVLVAGTGQAAINAVSTVEFLSMVFVSMLMALAAAGSVLVAQYVGAADPDGVRRTVVGTIWTAALPAVVVSVALLIAMEPVTALLLGPLGGDAVALGRVYLTASALAYPAFGIVEGAAAVLRGTARTRPALHLVAVMHGGYLVLAVVLVLGAGLGVTGLGIAVVASRWCAVVVAILLLRLEGLVGRGWAPWRPVRSVLSRMGLLALPFVVEQVFFNGGKLIVQTMLVGLGPGPVTVNAIIASLTMFSEIVPVAMGTVLIPLVGQTVGAGRHDEARRLIRSFFVASIVVMGAVSLGMLAFFDRLLDLYGTAADLRGQVLLIFVASLVARLLGWWSASFIYPSALRAAGDAVFTTATASITMFARVVAIWVVGVVLGHGVVGVWFVMMVEWGVRGFAFWWRLRGDTWQSKGWT